MTRALAGLVAGILLGTAGIAGAVIGNSKAKALQLQPGQAVTFGGLTCTPYKGTTATNANVVCVRNNLKGYGVVVSQDTVVVARRVSGKVKVVFQKPNR